MAGTRATPSSGRQPRKSQRRLSPAERSLLAARAMTLDERRAAGAAIRGGRLDGGGAVLARWARWYAAGDLAALDRRLGWDGWSVREVATLLADSPDTGGGRAHRFAPDWITALDALLECTSAPRPTKATGARRLPDGVSAPPFATLWSPWVAAAERRLLASCPALREDFAPQAIAALEGALLRQLCGVSAPTLMERFEAVRSGPDGTPSAGAFDRFVEHMRSGGLRELLLEHPPLARLLVLLVDTWVDASAELARRVRRDRPALERAFGCGSGLGRVREVCCGLSDRHHGGRQVSLVRFSRGVEVLYKPRDLRLEAAFHGFVSWLGRQGVSPALPALRVLVRDGYGWVEKARQEPLADDAEVREYFRRAGALLCLAHVLGGSDLHMDNVVATRSGPVLIDTETLLQPDWAGDSQVGGAAATVEASERALRTGLLAFPWLDPQGHFVDIGGLRGVGGYLVAERGRRWKEVNGDGMAVSAGPLLAPSQRNEVWAEGRRRPPGEYAADVLDGFASMYRALVRLRPVIAKGRRGLPSFASARTRIVLRPSQKYATLLVALAAPRHLRDGVERSIALDLLNRPFAASRRRPRLWALAAEERQALENLDVPVFAIGVGETTPRSRSGERIAGVLSRSGLQAVRDRLAALSEDDLERQARLVSRTLRLPEGRHSLVLREGAAPSTGDGLEGCAIPRGLLLEIAGDTAEIVARALPRARRTDLYGGSLGMALFLAAFSSVTGERSHREAVLRTCSRVARGALDGDRPEAAGLGACSGLGGVLYGLAAIGALLGESGPLDDATRVARLVSRARIREDRRLDVEGGAAGAILGALAVHGALDRPGLVVAAAACGDHLLRHSRSAGDGTRTWIGRDGVPRTGFAHGAAGIAWALAALHGATMDDRYRVSCLEACAWERASYDAALGAWPVLAGPEHDPGRRRVAMGGWCNGAAGIALSRAAILTRLRGPGLDDDLRLAARLAWQSPADGLDHLCCGSFGITESLLTIAQLQGFEDGVRAVSSRTTSMVGRAMTVGGMRLSRTRAGGRDLGLFHGEAGIGYALLRLAAPAKVPALLAFAAMPEEAR